MGRSQPRKELQGEGAGSEKGTCWHKHLVQIPLETTGAVAGQDEEVAGKGGSVHTCLVDPGSTAPFTSPVSADFLFCVGHCASHILDIVYIITH